MRIQSAVDVVGPDGGEGADVAGHAGHEAGDQGGDAEAEQSGAAVAREHERQHFVIGVRSPAAGRLRRPDARGGRPGPASREE